MEKLEVRGRWISGSSMPAGQHSELLLVIHGYLVRPCLKNKQTKRKRRGTRNRNLLKKKKFKTGGKQGKKKEREKLVGAKLPEETRSKEKETTYCRKTGTVQEHSDTDGEKRTGSQRGGTE